MSGFGNELLPFLASDVGSGKMEASVSQMQRGSRPCGSSEPFRQDGASTDRPTRSMQAPELCVRMALLLCLSVWSLAYSRPSRISLIAMRQFAYCTWRSSCRPRPLPGKCFGSPTFCAPRSGRLWHGHEGLTVEETFVSGAGCVEIDANC